MAGGLERVRGCHPLLGSVRRDLDVEELMTGGLGRQVFLDSELPSGSSLFAEVRRRCLRGAMEKR